MSYRTSYYMEVKGIKNQNEFCKLCARLREKGLFGWVFEEPTFMDDDDRQYFLTDDAVSWYEYDDDMKQVSTLFPNLTFRLDGNGEDTMDIWSAYYKNGDVEYTEVELPPPKRIVW